jgi:hypothetical protein
VGHLLFCTFRSGGPLGRLACNAFNSRPLFPTCKFTIDKSPDLQYSCTCYLEETSPTAPDPPALTLDASISCRLLPLFFPLPSFVFNNLQPLLPKYRGWGVPLQRCPLESAVYRLFFSRPFMIWLTPRPTRLPLPRVFSPPIQNASASRHIYRASSASRMRSDDIQTFRLSHFQTLRLLNFQFHK